MQITHDEPGPDSTVVYSCQLLDVNPRARICKRLRSPASAIDSKESIQPAYVARRRAGTPKTVVVPARESIPGLLSGELGFSKYRLSKKTSSQLSLKKYLISDVTTRFYEMHEQPKKFVSRNSVILTTLSITYEVGW
jgi:hypothetical protein